MLLHEVGGYCTVPAKNGERRYMYGFLLVINSKNWLFDGAVLEALASSIPLVLLLLILLLQLIIVVSKYRPADS